MTAEEERQVAALHKRLAESGRGCGDCSACCTIMGVDMAPLPEPNKPERTRCGHLCSKGCSVYDAKPESCSVFMCLWLAMELFDRMPAKWRPDKVGAVVDVNEVGTVTVHLKHENAWRKDGPLRDLLEFLAKGQNHLLGERFVVLDRPSGQHLLYRQGGVTEELVACGVGPNGLKQFRTKFLEEM